MRRLATAANNARRPRRDLCEWATTKVEATYEVRVKRGCASGRPSSGDGPARLDSRFLHRGDQRLQVSAARHLRKEPGDTDLEVLNKAGEWTSVPVIENTFIVNIGDLMQQWTNDRWISTMQRVVTPPMDSEENRDRIPIVFFHQPNYDAKIECLPTCLEPGETPKFAPVSSGDHLLSKFVKQTTFGKGEEAV